MSTPRFQLNAPDEPSNSLKNLNFIPRFLQDPLLVTLKDPTPTQQAILLNEAGVTLHPYAFEMIATALKEGKELDRNVLSYIAEIGRAIIEEATSLVWSKGAPEVSRYVVIKRVEPEESEMDIRNEELSEPYFNGNILQLTIENTDQGEIKATLGWENGDCAESHQSLIHRWEKVDTVFRRLNQEPPPLDLLPHAVAHCETRGDDEYHINGLTLACYPMNRDVMLQDLYRDERAARHDEEDEERYCDNDPDNDDEEEEFQSFTSSPADADNGDLSLSDLHSRSLAGNEPEDDSDLEPSPGQDLTIIDPTPGQLSTIANLSSMRITRGLAEHLLHMTRTKAPITPQDFEFLAPSMRELLAIHRCVTYTLEGAFSEAHRYSIDECALDKPTMFSIDLFRQPSLRRGTPDFVKSVLRWEQFSADADIPNWDRILKAAKERRL